MITLEGPNLQSRRKVGEPLVLWAIASGVDDPVGLDATWTRDGHAVAPDAVTETSPRDGGEVKVTLRLPAARSTDAGSYQLRIARPGDQVAMSEPLAIELEAGGPPIEAAADGPMVWDGRFARNAGLTIVGVLAVALVPLWWAVARILGDGDPTISEFVAFGLVIAAFVALGAAVLVALLELRGRARTAEQLSAPPTGSTRAMPTPDQVGELMKTFGSLKVPAALMVLSATCFLGAFGLAWKDSSTPPPVTIESGG